MTIKILCRIERVIGTFNGKIIVLCRQVKKYLVLARLVRNSMICCSVLLLRSVSSSEILSRRSDVRRLGSNFLESSANVVSFSFSSFSNLKFHNKYQTIVELKSDTLLSDRQTRIRTDIVPLLKYMYLNIYSIHIFFVCIRNIY